MTLRVLFTTQPGLGHLFPLLPIADGLRRRGHDVRFATSRSFGADIAAAGHEHVPAGRDWLTTDMGRCFPELAAVAPGPQRYHAGRTVVFAGRTAVEIVPDLLDLAAGWPPDVVLRDAAEYGGCLAAELLDVPHAVVRTDSGSSSHADRHVVADALTASRRQVGLPPDPDVEMPFRYLQLSFAPPGLDEPEELAAPTCHRLRPAERRTLGGGAIARCRAARADRPLVYVTLGTVFADTALLTSILDALRDERLDVIVTVGPGQDPAALGPRADNVHVTRWIPQAELLPHCDAVITHGGYGTVSAALSHGVPLVVVPISADQPLNAARCEALGAGLTVAPDDRTPDRIRAATVAVLDDPAFRQAALRVAGLALERPALDHALDLVEALAAERAPIPVGRCGTCRPA